MSAEQNKKKLKACACKNLRMTTRVITQYYDQAFHPVELRATQFALLADISARNTTTISELVDVHLMDQTTLTRNVELLKKNGYLNVQTDESDFRKKCINITEKGREKLSQALPLWEKAQKHLEDGIGQKKYDDFLSTLSQIQQLIHKK